MFVRGSIRTIPEEDYLLIESEMRKIRSKVAPLESMQTASTLQNESDYISAIEQLPLTSAS
jgi:hypothetical protein